MAEVFMNESAVTEFLKSPESYTHPLDELDPDKPLDADTRVFMHKEALYRVRLGVRNKEYTPELNLFPEDVLAKEIFIRRAREDDGRVSSVAVGVGKTISDIPGMNDTPNTFYAHPSNLDRLTKANKQERERIFRDEIIAGAEYFVIMGHGWGGKGKNFERYAMELLNGNIKDAEAIDKHGNKIILTEEDLSKTLVITLDVMGSNNSIDEENAHLYTEDKIISQWWEAIDRIGLQVQNIKTKTLVSQAKAWEFQQSENLKDVYHALKKNGYMMESDKAKLLSLLQFIDLAEKLGNGTWWQESIAILFGHSMGGNKVLDSSVAANLLNRPEVVEYRKNWRNQAEATIDSWSEGVNLMKIAFGLQIENPQINAFYEELRKKVKEIQTPSRFVSDDTLLNAPLTMNVALTPAIVGDKNNVRELQKYLWLFENVDKAGITPRKAIDSILLHKGDIINRALIAVPNWLAERNLEYMRKMAIDVVRITPLMDNKLVKHIGGKDTKFSNEMIAGTADEVMRNGTAVSRDSVNLKVMTPPFESIENVSPEEWDVFNNNLAIYGCGKDLTVDPKLTRQLARKLLLSGDKKPYEGGIYRESPESNHHLNQSGLDMFMSDLRGFLARNKMLRYQQIFDVYKNVASF